MRLRPLLTALLLLPSLLALLVTSRSAAAQIDPAVRDAVIPAAVQIGIPVTVTDNGQTYDSVVTFGSGTVVSPGGIVLTNHHVVAAGSEADLRKFQNEQQSATPGIAFARKGDRFAILTTDGRRETELRYFASLVAEDPKLDLAVLRIDQDLSGAQLVPSTLNLPFVPLGDSDRLDLADDLHVFGYPVIGGRAMTYAPGVVSGFRYEDGVDGPAWIVSDVLISGGDSGGTAVDAAGTLVGIPTAGTPLDCRPGDTNGDGLTDQSDIGCVPTGGSLAQIRPVNLAKPLLQQAAPDLNLGSGDATGTSPAPSGSAETVDPRAAAERCLAAADWLCATKFLERALAAAPGDAPLTGQLVDAYLQRGASEEASGRLTDARASYRRAAELDPARGEAQAALDRIGGYGTVVFRDDFGGQQRFTPASDGDASAEYADGAFLLTESAPGRLFTYPLGESAGNVSAAVDLRAAEGDGYVLLQVRGDGEWIFGVDPVRKRWTLLRVEPGAQSYDVRIAPADFGPVVAEPITRVEVRIVDGAPQLLVNSVDVPTAQGMPLPTVNGSTFGFGVSMDPDGTTPFRATFDAVALYALS